MSLAKHRPIKLKGYGTENVFWSFGTSNSAGVAVFFSPRFPGEIVRYLFDSNRRILSLLIDFQNYRFNLVNVYAPTAVSERKSFFSCLHDFFISQGTLIIGGDFNCFDNTLDKFNCSIVRSIDKSSLRSLKSDFSLTDIWRKQNPQKILFTWSNSDHSQMSRIDRFLIANSLLPDVLSSDILPCVLSDHDFITLEFSVNGLLKHGLGVWKFNVSLLSDPDFKKLLSHTIADFKSKIHDFASICDWWDSLKVSIRDFCIRYCVRKRKSANKERTFLTKCLIRARNALHARKPGLSSADSEIKNVESAHLALIRQPAEGAKIRSRAQWFEQGEKPTRYFFRLETKRSENNFFACLLDDTGVEKTSQNDLEPILIQFYTSLFTKDTLDMQIQTKLIDDLDLSLTDSERASCEGPLSENELLFALKGLQTGKSPGSDGLPTEFYLAFWDDLGASLTAVLNECF